MPSKKSPANRALGAAIRAARNERGVSQEAFAREAGLDRSYMGAIERGEFNVTLDTLVKIADGLGVPAWKLLKRSGAFCRCSATCAREHRAEHARPAAVDPTEGPSFARAAGVIASPDPAEAAALIAARARHPGLRGWRPHHGARISIGSCPKEV